jgi:hypothetical protein
MNIEYNIVFDNYKEEIIERLIYSARQTPPLYQDPTLEVYR